MDWLIEQKDRGDVQLVKRHISDGGFVCYDVSLSFVEGSHNELYAFGHSRAAKRTKRQAEYGVIATRDVLTVAIEVFSGNASEPVRSCDDRVPDLQASRVGQ